MVVIVNLDIKTILFISLGMAVARNFIGMIHGDVPNEYLAYLSPSAFDISIVLVHGEDSPF